MNTIEALNVVLKAAEEYQRMLLINGHSPVQKGPNQKKWLAEAERIEEAFAVLHPEGLAEPNKD